MQKEPIHALQKKKKQIEIKVNGRSKLSKKLLYGFVSSCMAFSPSEDVA